MQDLFHLSQNQNPPGCRNATAMHVHDYHQLLYFTSGEGEQSADGWKIPLHAGDIFFVPSGTGHRSVFPPGKKSKCYVLDFHGDLFTPALPGDKEALDVIEKMAWFRGKVALSAAGGARLRPIFDELFREFQRKEPAYQAMLKMMLLRILIVINTHGARIGRRSISLALSSPGKRSATGAHFTLRPRPRGDLEAANCSTPKLRPTGCCSIPSRRQSVPPTAPAWRYPMMGLERPPKYPGRTAFSRNGGTESGILDAEIGTLPPDLAEVIAAWPNLGAGERKAILEIVGKATAGAGRNEGD